MTACGGARPTRHQVRRTVPDGAPGNLRKARDVEKSGDRKYIELSIPNVEALFNRLDPSPFRSKDLARDAEDFIVGWAREYGASARLALRIYVADSAGKDASEMVREAIHNFFAYRAQLTRLEFRRVMAEGRVGLAIGLGFLFTCLFIRAFLPRGGSTVFSFLSESLTIAGWVGMWQPLQTYLYDWWPLRRRHRVYSELSRVEVELVAQDRRASGSGS